MQKRVLSVLLSIVVLLGCISVPMLANAQTYEEKLLAEGFPKSYVSALVDLHNKYPNWVFKPFVTGLDWNTAVAGERSPHSDQRVQKRTGVSDKYFCKCSNCYKNGSYVIREGSNWVSASKEAVEYYMDPRNWLDKEHIMQFETTAYDSAQTKAGVESIISNTWMHNALISYKSTTLVDKLYADSTGNNVKYSTAIMNAAKNSGMGAYYLASKIVQEVGGAKPTAGGVCGTRVPFTGIYNYFNIGAYGGADDGLAWAAGFLKTRASTTLYSTYNTSTGVVSGTKTLLQLGQRMTWMNTCGDYYKVRLYTEYGPDSYSKDGKIGYVPKSACLTTHFSYGRPWSNPYKAIYNGAEYISENFQYQFTSYLQKFNVNKESPELYGHEYMTNLDGAMSEATINYQAYKNADILSAKKTFYIPVFKNMPSKKCPEPSTIVVDSAPETKAPAKPTNFSVSSKGTDYISLKWNSVPNADGYYLYRYYTNTGKSSKLKTLKTNTFTHSGLTNGSLYSYYVVAYNSAGTSPKSNIRYTATKPLKVTALTPVAATTNHTITAKWNALSRCTGYQVQYSRYKDFSNIIATVDVPSKKTTSYNGKNFTTGVTYYVRVRAYCVSKETTVYGSWSSTKTVKGK